MEKAIETVCVSTFSFDWKIGNFSSLSDRNTDKIESPPFQCSDAVWNISLYPNGEKKEVEGCLSVYLKKRHPKDSKRVVDLQISAKCGDEIINIGKMSKTDFSVNSVWGSPKLVKRAEVLEKLRTSSQKVLTISCVITWNTSVADTEPQGSSLENVPIASKSKASVETLICNLKELYLNQRNSDFTISVKGEVLPAHKLILGAGSSVFAAAFAHDTSENRNATMEINDFQPHIVSDFLLYMYTGDVANMSCENVFDLYAISDKYDVQDMKEECLEFMKSKLSLETVCEVLLLAEKYTEEELFELAKNFVAKCAAELLKSDHWKTLESENVLLTNEILKIIVLDNAWRIK